MDWLLLRLRAIPVAEVQHFAAGTILAFLLSWLPEGLAFAFVFCIAVAKQVYDYEHRSLPISATEFLAMLLGALPVLLSLK